MPWHQTGVKAVLAGYIPTSFWFGYEKGAIRITHIVYDGNIVARQGRNVAIGYTTGSQFIPPDVWAKHLVDEKTAFHNQGVMGVAQGDAVLEAIESSRPYPIKMLWFQSTNPIACMAAEAPRVYNALKKMDFNVVVDLFMTPTAVACADIVLPAGMSSERNCFRTWYGPLRRISKVSSYYEAKSDEQIVVDLGNRLNPELFKEMKRETDIDLLDWVLHSVREGAKPAQWPIWN